MPNKTRDFGTATLGGIVATGIVTVVLEMAGAADYLGAFFFAVGAFIGGLVAAYLLYGKISQAAIAGVVSGLLGTFFYLGISDTLAIFAIIPIPSGPRPELSQLQAALTVIIMMNLIAGTLGATILSAVHHAPKELPPPPPPPGSGTVQVRYCVQCGAQLPTGAMICPHCNARQ